MVTGSASMMSATVTPVQARGDGASAAPRARADCRAGSRARPARCRRTRLPVSARNRPKPISSAAKPWPSVAPTRAWPCARSPVIFQIAARAIRPPSSGNAGTRLNTSSSAFIVTRKETSSSAASDGAVAAEPRRRRRSRPSRPAPIPTALPTSTIASVTSGPGDRDAELLAGRVGVPAHLHHAAEEEEVDAGRPRCPRAARPARGRARAARSSRRTATAAATRGRRSPSCWSPRMSVNDCRQPEDEQEQDQEPGGVDADPDPEDPSQLE